MEGIKQQKEHRFINKNRKRKLHGIIKKIRIILGSKVGVSHRMESHDIYIGWPRTDAPEKNLNTSITTHTKGLIYLSIIEACSNFISMRTWLEKLFC